MAASLKWTRIVTRLDEFIGLASSLGVVTVWYVLVRTSGRIFRTMRRAARTKAAGGFPDNSWLPPSDGRSGLPRSKRDTRAKLRSDWLQYAGFDYSDRDRAARDFVAHLGDKRVHGLKARRIDDRPALAPRGHKRRRAQLVEMKGQRVWRQIKRRRHFARRHAFGAGLHEKAEHIKAVVLGKGCQRRYSRLG